MVRRSIRYPAQRHDTAFDSVGSEESLRRQSDFKVFQGPNDQTNLLRAGVIFTSDKRWLKFILI